jgi:hypothetical protein
MDAAVQQIRGTMSALAATRPTPIERQFRRVELPAGLEPFVPVPQRMTTPKPREYFIQGITHGGRAFRPSDWAERLAGALSSFRPKGSHIGAHIGYSPYCIPRVVDNVKCVIVNEALREIEPMAWDFVMNFARDNELQVVEACSLPDPPRKRKG